MATVGFIGTGNMGGPMVVNLLSAGHHVKAYDHSADALGQAVTAGATACGNANEAATDVDVVITMLPAGDHVRDVILEHGLLQAVGSDTVIVDCSTIDVRTAQELHAVAAEANVKFVDSPVSGGVMGARAASLTLMCGGEAAVVDEVRDVLDAVSGRVVHCGGPGMGQLTKIANNMIAAITTLAVSEAFTLAERLGADRQTLWDVFSTSSSGSWVMREYCPMPGPVETSPANNDFQPGFAAELMLKDLTLAAAAAEATNSPIPLGGMAKAAYSMHVNNGFGGEDFASICKLVNPDVR